VRRRGYRRLSSLCGRKFRGQTVPACPRPGRSMRRRGNVRLRVVLEAISRGYSAVSIRNFVLRAARLHDLVEFGTLTPRPALCLKVSLRAGLNILVAGVA
jgi:Flp pilus assembly CpaF family ATPase